MEWYRLALRHCPHNYLLHDDFYRDDGTACQPKESVVDLDKFPAPTLEECSTTIEGLWNFTLTRFALREPLFQAWRKHPAHLVLEHLTHAYESYTDCHRKATVLELCEHCLTAAACDLVRRAWLDYPQAMYFGALAAASVACLPPDDGFERCLAAFNAMPLKDQRPRMMYMRKFRNPKMLDWIEQHIQSPVTNDWGNLAADSEINWERTLKWLTSGRPLSLVALDALLAIFYVDENGRQKNYRSIEGLPDSDEFTQSLQAHLTTDSAPRVENSIDIILEGYRAAFE